MGGKFKQKCSQWWFGELIATVAAPDNWTFTGVSVTAVASEYIFLAKPLKEMKTIHAVQ